MNRTKEMIKLFMYEMPRTVKAILYISLFTWAFYGYKQWEGIVNPVVVDFAIDEVVLDGANKRIAGSMNKVRDCSFEQVVAYSGDHLVDIQFADVRNVVSRVKGSQAWGWWVVVPAVDTLTLYSRHMCFTGEVLTKLYEGKI